MALRFFFFFLKREWGWDGDTEKKGLCAASLTDIAGCCVTLGCHIWVRPPSLAQASCEILQGVLFNINMGEKGDGFREYLVLQVWRGR